MGHWSSENEDGSKLKCLMNPRFMHILPDLLRTDERKIAPSPDLEDTGLHNKSLAFHNCKSEHLSFYTKNALWCHLLKGAANNCIWASFQLLFQAIMKSVHIQHYLQLLVSKTASTGASCKPRRLTAIHTSHTKHKPSHFSDWQILHTQPTTSPERKRYLFLRQGDNYKDYY